MKRQDGKSSMGKSKSGTGKSKSGTGKPKSRADKSQSGKSQSGSVGRPGITSRTKAKAGTDPRPAAASPADVPPARRGGASVAIDPGVGAGGVAAEGAGTRRRFRVMIETVVEVEDALIADVLTDEWRERFYPLRDPGDVAAHLAFNLVQGRSVESLDGFADQAPSSASLVVMDLHDGVVVDELLDPEIQPSYADRSSDVPSPEGGDASRGSATEEDAGRPAPVDSLDGLGEASETADAVGAS